MIQKTSFLLLFLFAQFLSMAQFKGVVKDAATGAPLKGVNIINNGKEETTDEFGSFLFQNESGQQAQLLVSHIGYAPKTITAYTKQPVEILLQRSVLNLSEVRITGRQPSPLTTISGIDVQLRPINNSQDILRIVPGLFIAQHAGGGKAEQIFLRGYDIDHGTDINITVDGVPVNMVSHAHGQGYADLHFLIPETVERVTFDNGPYTASKGNMATAGYVEFATKNFLANNSIRVEAGQFNTQRAVGLLKLLDKENESVRQQLYIASEYFLSDGYVESPQDFHRFNGMAKYTALFNNQTQLTLTASHFDSKWNASGQIPVRAVQQGLITRFGAIDDTEGGATSRSNAIARLSRQWANNWQTTHQLYYTRYNFNLYSNFTFYLNDATNGDQIQQKEARSVLGYDGSVSKGGYWGSKKVATTFGAGFRHDDVDDIELSKTIKRTLLEPVQKGDIQEWNAFAYAQQSIDLTRKLNLTAALRFDHFTFGYKNELLGATHFSRRTKGVASPKLKLDYTVNPQVKLFAHTGVGFHSNDTRVILDNEAADIVPKVYATDIGTVVKPFKNLLAKATLWHIYSEQEFIYVGDEGIVEPSGKTRRLGLDLSARYQITNWLFADADVNLTRARSTETPKGEDYVPLAPKFTSMGGITAKNKKGFSGSLRYRYIADRPANETASVTAKGYFLTDLLLTYQWKRLEFFASLENILNAEWEEAQFDTESRLLHELEPISEIHYTPGTPRFFKAGVTFTF